MVEGQVGKAAAHHVLLDKPQAHRGQIPDLLTNVLGPGLVKHQVRAAEAQWEVLGVCVDVSCQAMEGGPPRGCLAFHLDPQAGSWRGAVGIKRTQQLLQSLQGQENTPSE